MSEFAEFEMVLVLRVKQRGVDRHDAAERALTSLASTLRDKCILPEEHLRGGFWNESLATRVQHDPFERIGQVLMIAPVTGTMI